MVESGAERHPKITRARDIAFQGRHDEDVLKRMNLILYRDFKKNIDDWRQERVQTLVEDKGWDFRIIEGDGFVFKLPWREFTSPEHKFSNFPHRKVVNLLFPTDELTVRVTSKRISLSNYSRGNYAHFEFEETCLTTGCCDQTALGYSDFMDGKSLMTKVSAAAEFVDMIDLSLNALKARTPTKAS